jgi:iron complex transport system substrate-binding protein
VKSVRATATSSTNPRASFYLRSSAFICGFLALCLSPPAAAAITVTDDLGRQVELREPAKRIVTLAPFLTELAFSAGAGARVAGVSEHSDHPPGARALPRVANAAAVSLERVAALQPDLVLAWRDTLHPADLERLGRLGIPVFVAQARSLADVPRLLEAVGRLAGTDVRAPAKAYRERLEAARVLRSGRERIPVFLEIWHQPLTTIAGPHWMNEALAPCGADNVFADLEGVAPVVSWEALYARDPKVIVGAGSAASEAQFRAQWKARDTLAAVKGGRLVFVDADTIQRPTLRLADGVAELCAGLDRVR